MASSHRQVLQAVGMGQAAKTGSLMPTSYTNEPQDDEERELMDPSTWDWDSAVVIEGREPVGVPVTIYIDEAIFNRLMDAAAKAGEPPISYIIQAALDRAEREAAAGSRSG